MDQAQLSWISNFIWGIADDVLRDVYVRGKYRDVILPMTVIRRLDALLEPTRQAVLDMKVNLDKAKIVHQDAALRTAAGQDFYNTFKWNLKDLKARSSQQQLKADFEAYLDGFSSNVQEILEKFKFRNQITTLVDANILGTMIEKFLSSTVNLSPNPVLNPDGSVKLPGLDNHAMGTVFEELIRRFNEENNEEAGEHFILDAINMDSYRAQKQVTQKLILDNKDALIDPSTVTGGGVPPEPELKPLDEILKEWHQQWGNIDWKDKDKVEAILTKELPAMVAQDKAFQNARQNSDEQNARIEHDKALGRAMTSLVNSNLEIFKLFSDNDDFKRFVTQTSFRINYDQWGLPPKGPQPGLGV